MTAVHVTELAENPTLRRILQPKRIPLLFSVTIIAGIFYHYAPEQTWLWILLSVVIQGLLFKLFDFVNRHHILGGIAYIVTGFCFLAVSLWLMQAGNEGWFAPEDSTYRIDFFVWFMTPQSVLPISYMAYTVALFLLFTFFIASIAYYFTIVRYRVLMSFVVMLFPFAIYAKEADDMPVPSIILLFLCYFAVMIYCRQAHGEHPELVQAYEPKGESRLSMPPHRSENADKTPEILDRRFVISGGIFLAAACITVLVLPKPTVDADRSFLDSMLDLSSLSNYLENAISGFTDSSDGGAAYTPSGYSRTLYLANTDEVLDLKVRTFTNYSYDDATWYATDYDGRSEKNDPRYHVDERDFEGSAVLDPFENSLRTLSNDQQPVRLLSAVMTAAEADSAFAERWGIAEMAGMTLDPEQYHHTMEMMSATFNTGLYPSPTHSSYINSIAFPIRSLYQNESGVIFRYEETRSFREAFRISYYSDALADSEPAKYLMQHIPPEQWAAFLSDLKATAEALGERGGADLLRDAQGAIDCYLAAVQYASHVQSDTPDRVRELALSLTADCKSDYEKAAVIYNYLKYGEFTYSLTYQSPELNNAEYFLFESKTGVCYEFASAMAELCRAAGLPVRYVEGYLLATENDSLATGGDWEYVITSDQAHAFTEVYLTGYGWIMLDATAPSRDTGENTKGNVLAALQIAGLILFGAAAVLLFFFLWLLPRLREMLFRARFRRNRNAAAVQEGFARLRKQWKADPTLTARELCAEQGAFLGQDLSVLCDVFEQTLYAERCTPEAAGRFYAAYCAAYDGWRAAVKRDARAKRAAQKAARAAAKAEAKAAAAV